MKMPPVFRLAISAAVLALPAAAAEPTGSPAPAVTLSRIGDSVVDASALTLPAGASFGSAINGLAFQQDAILSFAGWQYVAYYDAARHVCVARRRLPNGPWQVARLLDYPFKGDDAHNTISLGIAAKDGTLHLAFDHHVTALHYRVSKPGVALQPDKFPWDASLFGPVQAELEPGRPLVVTYPRFWSTPDGGLQLHYRRGSSGSGDNMLADYRANPGTWSTPRQVDSGDGDFQDELGKSTHRNAYPNGYDYDAAGRLHATWVWRENAHGSNHDLLYAASDDQGKTWITDSGQPITGPANLGTPGLAVAKISRRQGLMNNQAQAVDSRRRVHVVMWSSTDPTPITARGADVWGPPAARRYHHYWREGTGKWHDAVLPWVAGSRPRLFVDDRDNLILIYNRPIGTDPMQAGIYFPAGDLVIASATAAAGWKDWRIVAEQPGPFLNEMLGDTSRWKTDRILSILTQETPKALGDPSPLRVIDYQWKDSP